MLLEMLAPAVQIAKTTFLALAPPVQTEKTAVGLLHHRSKREKLLFSPCTTGANRKNHFLALAPSVQIAKTTF